METLLTLIMVFSWFLTGARRVRRRGLDEALAKSLLFYFLINAPFRVSRYLCSPSIVADPLRMKLLIALAAANLLTCYVRNTDSNSLNLLP
jgi:hypothetical protein